MARPPVQPRHLAGVGRPRPLLRLPALHLPLLRPQAAAALHRPRSSEVWSGARSPGHWAAQQRSKRGSSRALLQHGSEDRASTSLHQHSVTTGHVHTLTLHSTLTLTHYTTISKTQ